MINANGTFIHSEIMKFAHQQTKENLHKYNHSYTVEFKRSLKVAYMVARTKWSANYKGKYGFTNVSTLGD